MKQGIPLMENVILDLKQFPQLLEKLYGKKNPANTFTQKDAERIVENNTTPNDGL